MSLTGNLNVFFKDPHKHALKEASSMHDPTHHHIQNEAEQNTIIDLLEKVYSLS